MRVELCTFNEDGEITDRRMHDQGFIESKIPKATREWLMSVIPAKPKEA